MALVPITHVYDTLSVINNTGLLDGQILYTTDQTVNKIFADVKVNNILRRIEIGGTNTIDTVLDQNSGHAIANSAVAKLAQTVHTNMLNPTIGTVTLNGITCTSNGDGTYTLSGTATDTAAINIIPYKNYDPSDESRLFDFDTKLRFTCMPSGSGIQDKLYAQIAGATASGGWKGGGLDFGNGITFTPQSDPFFLYVVRVVVAQGQTVPNNLVIKPMLTTDLSATYNDYVPYSGDGELNENVADLYKNLNTTNSNLTALDTKVGTQSLLPTPSQSVTQNINTLKAEINQLNSDLSDIGGKGNFASLKTVGQVENFKYSDYRFLYIALRTSNYTIVLDSTLVPTDILPNSGIAKMEIGRYESPSYALIGVLVFDSSSVRLENLVSTGLNNFSDLLVYGIK